MFRASARRLFAAALLASVAACAPNYPIETASVPQIAFDPMTTVVKVNVPGGGHGSGVHIGGGIIITAAHVTKGGVETVSFESGVKEKATVLWQNEDYDVAAIRFAPDATVVTRAAVLDCTTHVDGDAVTARGNPGILDFVSLRGYVAGKVREQAPSWKEVFIADISGAGGISGGPVFDDTDAVVGIVVGGMLTPLARNGEAYDMSQTGLTYVVPGSTICMLLGRG